MRLAELLSKPPNMTFSPIEGFTRKQLAVGEQRQLDIGSVGLNFYCKQCNDIRTFWSSDRLYCIGVNERQISIDCVVNCRCATSVALWFLVESYSDITGQSPEVRIMKRREKLPDGVALSNEQYGDFAELFEKANQAYRDGLGAGSIVHLRKIMERITVQTATAIGISVRGKNGSRIPFKNLLDKVEKKHPVIPQEFSADGYRLFSELSDVVHGEYDEQLGLSKFKALHRLVVGILDNVRNNDELRAAKGLLGWELVEAQRDE